MRIRIIPEVVFCDAADAFFLSTAGFALRFLFTAEVESDWSPKQRGKGYDGLHKQLQNKENISDMRS